MRKRRAGLGATVATSEPCAKPSPGSAPRSRLYRRGHAKRHARGRFAAFGTVIFVPLLAELDDDARLPGFGAKAI
jgi:hypothetical protein